MDLASLKVQHRQIYNTQNSHLTPNLRGTRKRDRFLNVFDFSVKTCPKYILHDAFQ